MKAFNALFQDGWFKMFFGTTCGIISVAVIGSCSVVNNMNFWGLPLLLFRRIIRADNNTKKSNSVDISSSSSSVPNGVQLSKDQIDCFKRDGVLVVRSVLSPREVAECREGLHACLKRLVQVDVENLEETAGGLRHLSSTNGSGGVLDIFYESFKLTLAEHPRIFSVITQLWSETFRSGEETDFKHPYGILDCSRGFAYIDRVGFRVPSRISELHCTAGSRKKRSSLQRSLTPHLDCCPENLYENKQGGKVVKKWRPIQCFVALTDTLEPNSGGFEAAKKHHINFQYWIRNRPKNPHKITSSKHHGIKDSSDEVSPSLCFGEFTAMRPQLDADVIQSMEHIPCSAGDLVLWDNRIPHANSYKNDTPTAREVVYLGWLPDIPLNRTYVAEQLDRFKKGSPIVDQWREDVNQTNPFCLKNSDFQFSELGECLMGIKPWNERKGT